jgi:hypothetical protein
MTHRLTGALVRMKPKPQEEMKVGKKLKKQKKAKRKPFNGGLSRSAYAAFD